MKYKEKNYKLIIDPKILTKQRELLYEFMERLSEEYSDEETLKLYEGLDELLGTILDQAKENK